MVDRSRGVEHVLFLDGTALHVGQQRHFVPFQRSVGKRKIPSGTAVFFIRRFLRQVALENFRANDVEGDVRLRKALINPLDRAVKLNGINQAAADHDGYKAGDDEAGDDLDQGEAGIRLRNDWI